MMTAFSFGLNIFIYLFQLIYIYTNSINNDITTSFGIRTKAMS